MNKELENGILNFNGKFTLSSHTTVNDLLSSKLHYDIEKWQDYGYIWYYLKPQILFGEYCSVSLIFRPTKLIDNVIFSFTGNVIYQWENWSENEMLKLKKKNDRFLRKQLGSPPYIFSWGEIASVFDMRSGSAHIIVKYN